MRKKPSELDFEEYIRQVEPAKREKVLRMVYGYRLAASRWPDSFGLSARSRQEKHRGEDFPEQGAGAH